MGYFPRKETQIGDFGKLHYIAERYCPDVFAKAWHHNGIAKTIRNENGKEILGVSFYNRPDQIIDVPCEYFDNFTKEYGTKPCGIANSDDCDPKVIEIIRKKEMEFYASVM